MNNVRQEILRRLIHEQNVSFNKLWDKKGESNKFAYHLKVLEEEGIITKNAKRYQLTNKGKKLAAYTEGADGKEAKFPVIAAIIIVFDKTKKKVLMTKRLKEPFYGYWGFIGGKIKFTQYIMECAEQELLEETGLKCNLELKGLFSSKTYHDNDLAFNHELFIIKGTNPKGKLIKKNREGECEWVKLEKVKTLNIFPNVPYSIKIVQSKNFRWIEADRFQKDGVFTSMHKLKDLKI
ncbi:MAG: NUDIX domain-containing protein [Candidatus Woesearchaeota archaeon]